MQDWLQSVLLCIQHLPSDMITCLTRQKSNWLFGLHFHMQNSYFFACWFLQEPPHKKSTSCFLWDLVKSLYTVSYFTKGPKPDRCSMIFIYIIFCHKKFFQITSESVAFEILQPTSLWFGYILPFKLKTSPQNCLSYLRIHIRQVIFVWYQNYIEDLKDWLWQKTVNSEEISEGGKYSK